MLCEAPIAKYAFMNEHRTTSSVVLMAWAFSVGRVGFSPGKIVLRRDREQRKGRYWIPGSRTYSTRTRRVMAHLGYLGNWRHKLTRWIRNRCIEPTPTGVGCASGAEIQSNDKLQAQPRCRTEFSGTKLQRGEPIDSDFSHRTRLLPPAR